MAKEIQPVGDPQLPQEERQNPFEIANPSAEVLRKVFDFPFPPHEMQVKFKKTGGAIIPMPFAVTLDSLRPTAGTGEHNHFGSGHFDNVVGDNYDNRVAALSKMIEAGFETVDFRVEKFNGKSGQLALTDNEVEEGTGFTTFNAQLLPTLVENGYQVSSISVHFDTGWFYWDMTPGYSDSSHRKYPHSLKFDGDTLSIYSKLSQYAYSKSEREKPITQAEDAVLREYWENLKAPSEQEKTK